MRRRRRKGERGESLDIAGERRELRCKAIEAVNEYEAVVEEIRMSDFNTFDEDLGAVRIRCDGDATAGEDGLDLGAKG